MNGFVPVILVDPQGSDSVFAKGLSSTIAHALGITLFSYTHFL